MRKNSFLKGVAFFMLMAVSLEANAASLYMDPAFSSIGRGDAVTVSVRLDTDEAAEECINAIDGVIRYSEDIALVDVSTGDSILSVWVEPPKINAQERTVTFAGGLPNGYCGRVPGDPRLTNNIVKLIFRSPGFSIGKNNSGTTTAKIEFAPETTAYLNDGFGTKAELALYGASIDLSDTPGSVIEDPWREAVVTDTIPPSMPPLELARIPNETGDWYVIFNAVDKQTGVDHYEIMEESLSKSWDFEWGRADAPWVPTNLNAYKLEDQSLNSTIRVRAIDKAGNEYIATLVPDEEMRGFSPQDIIVFVGFGLLGLILLVIVIVAGRGLWKRRKEKKLLIEEDVNEESHD